MAWPTSLAWISAACAEVRLRTPCLGSQWNLHEMGHALVVDQLVGVDARAFHLAIVGRDAPGRLQRRSPCAATRGACRTKSKKRQASWRLVTGSGLKAWIMSGNLMASRMKKTLRLLPTRSQLPSTRLELDREAARVARRLGAFLGAGHGREAHEHRRLHAGLVEHAGARVFGGRLVADLAIGLELAMRAGAAGMHDALRDALAVEMGDLLDELVVLERRGTALADRAGRLVVADRDGLGGS